MKEAIVPIEQDLNNKVYTVRGVQVMLDADLAFLYNVVRNESF